MTNYTIYTANNCPQCDLLKNMAKSKNWSGLEFVQITEANIDHLKSIGIRSAPGILRKEDSSVVTLNSFLYEMDSRKAA